MSDLTVRKARPEDAAALLEMNDAFNGPGTTAERISVLLEDGDRSEIVLIAEGDHTPLGFLCGQVYTSICYHAGVGEITELYVKQAARRQGAGTALIRAAEAEFRARGVSEIKIYTGRGNSAAQALYEATGYAGSATRMYVKGCNM